jgi:hypothetical protein
MDLDDLRSLATKGDDDAPGFDFDEDDAALARLERAEVRQDKLFLGMRPVERMMLSVFMFLNVLVLTLAFLLATGRLVL